MTNALPSSLFDGLEPSAPDAARLAALRERLLGLDDSGAASVLQALREQHEASVQALEDAVRREAHAMRALAVAQDVIALKGGLQDAEFLRTWRPLLDTTNRDPGRYDALDQAMRALAGPRQVLVRTSMKVRLDNRQVVLALYPHRDETMHAKLFEFLLKVLPLIVNEAATGGDEDWRSRAAILEVWSRNISDKEWLTLLAHPASGNYELVREWRSETSVEKRFDTLREALDYLRENHAYY